MSSRSLSPWSSLVATAACVAGMIGCGMDLPLQERIESIRPLAVRSEVLGQPPGQPVRLEALPFERVGLVPFIVDDVAPFDPQEIRALDPIWIRCTLQPIQGLFGCLSEALPLEPDALETCPEVDPSTLDPSSDMPPASPSPCRLEVDDPARPEFAVPLDFNLVIGGDLELTMVGHRGDDVDSSTCLERLLAESDDIPEDCLFVTQRVPVGPDFEIIRQAQMLGLVDPDTFGPLPEEPVEPDAHPRIASFTVQVFDENDVAVTERRPVDRGETLRVQRGHRLAIETEAPEDDLQCYPISDGGNGFIEQCESYRGSWFRTWGELLSPVSDDPLSRNEWTMERGDQDDDELPPGDRATLYYVLRDTRQGVDWWWFDVEVSTGS